jgi:hypothetical protein
VFSSPQVILFSEHVERTVRFYLGLGFSEAFRVSVTGEPIHVDIVLDGIADPDGNPVQLVQPLRVDDGDTETLAPA